MGWILLICLIVLVLALFFDETGLDWTDFLPF